MKFLYSRGRGGTVGGVYAAYGCLYSGTMTFSSKEGVANGNALLFKLRRHKDVRNEFPAALYRRIFQFLPRQTLEQRLRTY